jgi:hypothetical protein
MESKFVEGLTTEQRELFFKENQIGNMQIA